MNKAWLVARATYRLGLGSGSFLMLTLGLPLLMVIVAAIAILQQTGGESARLGYVDQTGQFSRVKELKVDGKSVRLQSFPDLAAAGSAVAAKDIDAYFVVPEGYFQGGTVRYYARDDANDQTQAALKAFLRHNLLPSATGETIDRLADPISNISFVGTETGTTAKEGFGMAMGVAVPMLLVGLFSFLVLSNAGQMGAAMIREKDQRAMEIILTSLSPWQLVAGKVIGLALLSLTQIGVWVAIAAIAFPLALARWAPGESLNVPVDVFGWALALFLPGYFLYVTLAAGVGIVAGDGRQAQQAAGLFGLVAMTPFFVIMTVMDAPNSPLVVGLSLFPLTAPMISIMRMAGTTVPAWQLLTAFGLTSLALAVSIWLVARVFRAAMLLYGQPLRPRDMWRALRGARQLGLGGRR